MIEVTHGQERIPGKPIVAPVLGSIPDDAWVALGIGDYRIIQNPIDKARVKSIVQYFMDENPGTDVPFALEKMMDLINAFGSPDMGMNRLDQMYKYVTIKRHIKK